ncbi:MAG: type II toxin-antitoxin system RelE/ParE family toxin [Nitrosomonadales bacterium]|nr:type II toxin-antitoxin system RelE/ParE family toxin [Nitrosomonadales bacterium]
MPRLIWSAAAVRDMARLHRFLAQKNADAARRAIQSIRIGVKNLAAQPQIGRFAENQKPEFRELLIEFGDSGYITLYRYADDTVTILAVRHQKEIGH